MCKARRDQTVASDRQRPVVILYEHALLGEGIAKYLGAHSGVEAVLVSAHDSGAVFSAMAVDPGVVIFEKHPIRQFDLGALAPHAILIDVSTVITLGSVATPCAAGLEQILQAVRDSSAVDAPSQTRQL
jgi:hypothetical protein